MPLLNCFLNGNGNAYADGTPLPVRYGTWLWGLGMSKNVFVPKKTGAGYDLPEELVALKNVRDQINLYTNLTAFRDGAFFCHFTGWMVFRSGTVADGGQPGALGDARCHRRQSDRSHHALQEPDGHRDRRCAHRGVL